MCWGEACESAKVSYHVASTGNQMHRYLALVAALTILAGTAARAGEPYRDHLVPEDSVIGASETSPDYQIILRDVFQEGYERDVKLRYIEIPSFHTESLVALKEDAGTFRILTLEPTTQLWAFESLAMMKRGDVLKIEKNDFEHGVKPDKEIAELEATIPEDYHKVIVKRCEVQIDTGIANRLLAVWKVMLLDTRYTQ